MKPPLVRFVGDTYSFHWLDDHIDMVMDRLHESRTGELSAEVEVRTSRDTPNVLLHHARLNLIATRSRQEIVRSLASRIPESQFDWSFALEEACFKAIKQWREGDPVIDLRKVEPQCGTRFLLEPYVERSGATVLFADGGSGKSLFAMALAASIASGVEMVGKVPSEMHPVLYLDWESDKDTHADRLRAVCAGAGIDREEAPIHYRRQAASLAESAPYIRRVVAEEQIGFVIIDSMGAARGAEPESADATIRLFNAARTLGVPWLGVDHVTKNGGDGQPKPFGSVYTHNLARLTWGMEKVEDGNNGHLIIALSNHKTNNGRPLGRRGYSVEIRQDENDRPTFVSYQHKDIAEIPGMFPRMGQPQQIAEVLRANRGSMTVEDIQTCLQAEGVSMKTDQIRVVLNRVKERFVPLPDGRLTRWGLRADGL